jgi:predicted transposase YbfD/YdcC
MKYEINIEQGCDPSFATAIQKFREELTEAHALLSVNKNLSTLIEEHLDPSFTAWMKEISCPAELFFKLSDKDVLIHHLDDLIKRLNVVADLYENSELSYEHVPPSVIASIRPTFRTIIQLLMIILNPKKQPPFGRKDRIVSFEEVNKKTGSFTDCNFSKLKEDRIKPALNEPRTSMFWLPEITHPIDRCRFCDALSEHEALRSKLMTRINWLLENSKDDELKRCIDVAIHLRVGGRYSLNRGADASHEFCEHHATQNNRSQYNKGRKEMEDFDFFLSILHFSSTKKNPNIFYIFEDLDPINDMINVTRFDPMSMETQVSEYPPLLGILRANNYRRFASFALQKNVTKDKVFKLIDYALSHRRESKELLKKIKEHFLDEIQEIANLLGLTAEQGLSADLSQFPQWKLIGES